MSERNIELVRALIERYNSNEPMDALAEAHWAEDIEVWPAPDFPEGGPYLGRDEGRRFFEGLREAWGPGMQVILGEMEAAGEKVLIPFEWRGRGEESSLEMSSNWWAVYTFGDGRVTCVQFFADADMARGAAGLA